MQTPPRAGWYTEGVPDPHALLFSVVTRLLDDPEIPARLYALGDHGAVLAMADGSLTALFTPTYGPPEELRGKLRALVEGNPGAHLKLAIVGGDAKLRELLPKDGASVLSRRAVQVFHLGPGEGREWVLWAGGGGRPDSPLGKVLAAAGRGELPGPPERAVLAQRVEPPPSLSPEERARLEEGQTFLAGLRVQPRATWGLLAALAVVFALEELWGGSETVPTLVRMGGNTETTLTGEPWRLLASALLHGGWVHLVMNGFALLMLGSFVERLLGAARYGVLLGAAAVGGSLASALAPSPLSVGASGAICGILGAVAVLAWRPGQVIPALLVGTLRRQAVINLVLVLAISFHPQVDAWAHLGGGLVGAALVYSGVLTRGLAMPGSGPSQGERGFAIAAWVVAGLAAASFAIACAKDRPWMLVAEPTWARRTIGEVSFEAPESLGEPVPIDAAYGVWIVGDPVRDGMIVLVEIKAQEPDPDALAKTIHELETEAPPLPAGAEAVEPWHRVEGPGPATFQQEFLSEDVLVIHSVQLRDDALVKLRTDRWPGLAAHLAGPARRIHASFAEAAAP